MSFLITTFSDHYTYDYSLRYDSPLMYDFSTRKLFSPHIQSCINIIEVKISLIFLWQWCMYALSSSISLSFSGLKILIKENDSINHYFNLLWLKKINFPLYTMVIRSFRSTFQFLNIKNINSLTWDCFQTSLNPCFSITRKFLINKQVIGQIITVKMSYFHIF